MIVEPRFKSTADAPAKKRKPLRTKPKTRHPELVANSECLLETVQGCQACDFIASVVPGWECGSWPVDVHHRRLQGPGRRKGGGHMLANLRVVCRKAHVGWIHDVRNQTQARELGLLVMPDDDEFETLGMVK